MECNFRKRRSSSLESKVGDHIIPKVTQFKYYGSIVQSDEEIEADVNHRIPSGWLKWSIAFDVLCVTKVPLELKGKLYSKTVRPTMLYETKCWTVKNQT